MRPLILSVLAMSAAILPAQRSKPVAGTRSATLEGDVYLMMKSGDLKKAAGQTVYLLRLAPETQGAIALACKTTVDAHEVSVARVAKAQASLEQAQRENMKAEVQLDLARDLTAAQLSLKEVPQRVDEETFLDVSRSRVDSAKTGINAHYRFANLRPGRYILFAQWPIGDHSYEWWVPVDLKPGRSIVDLDHTSVAEDPFQSRCAAPWGR